MSATFDRVRELARQRKVRVSRHGYGRLAARGKWIAEVVAGGGEAIETIRTITPVLRFLRPDEWSEDFTKRRP